MSENLSPEIQPKIAALWPLFQELNDLKRLRSAQYEGSIAERIFVRSWARLVAGESLESVALSETARALVATKLADVDARVLADAGLENEEIEAIFERVLESSALEASGADALFQSVLASAYRLEEGANLAGTPAFVQKLKNQPRAGATRPGFSRVVLEPTENHAEHCAVVAVGGVLAAPIFGADLGQAFLVGLCHHFHNAFLPDAGDAGDHFLGDSLPTIQRNFRERAILQLPPDLQDPARESLDAVYRSDTPLGRGFQVADVFDRTREMDWHARSANFTLSVALDDMDIVHPGPVQAFQLQIMRAVGLK